MAATIAENLAPRMLEGASTEAARARFEDRELLQHFEEAEQLPREDKQLMKEFLSAFLMRRRLERMVAR